jgi:hypothetical protein
MSSTVELPLAVLAIIAIVLVVRLLFAREDRSLSTYDQSGMRDRDLFNHRFGSSAADKPANPAPVSNDLGRVRVMQFNFEHFDAVPGPPDPESFADELIVELYDSVSDFRWTATYVVATPSGIRKLMDDERWSFFYSTEIFIVRRYDLETIRKAVYGRIKEIHDNVPLDAEEPPLRG